MVLEANIKSIWVPSTLQCFPENWRNQGYISYIKFSRPILDFKKKKNERLQLDTFWAYRNNENGPAYWEICLKREEGSIISEFDFANLDSFKNYDERGLGNWQRFAWGKHRYF